VSLPRFFSFIFHLVDREDAQCRGHVRLHSGILSHYHGAIDFRSTGAVRHFLMYATANPIGPGE
jgi:hypothetical protein